MSVELFPQLEIPHTIAAGLGPGNTDIRVLKAFASAGVADHMQPDVLRGMIECKNMLRRVWGTDNIHTFGVAGTGWSGLDVMMSAVRPGDKVVVFANGTFSGIDALTLQMKAATKAARAAGYARHEGVLREALEAMGCDVTSNMRSLVVLNLPGALSGREMELVQNCRARGFGIWPTLSSSVQVRVGILNLLTPAAITDIVNRFADAMREQGARIVQNTVNKVLDRHYPVAIAAE